MKVMIVSSLFAPWRRGGAEVVAESSARMLTDLGHEVHVLTLSPDQGRSQNHQDGYQVQRIPLRNVYPLQEMDQATTLQRVRWHAQDRWNTAMQVALTDELAILQPEVVLLHNLAGFSVSIYQALSNASVPFVQVLHDHYFCCLYSTMYRQGKSCDQRCLRCDLVRRRHAKTTQLATGVIGVSHFILNRVKEFGCFSGVSSQVIHNLASTKSQVSSPDMTHVRRSGLGCTLGYLGILSEPKGVMDLISAFGISAGPFDRLKLAGHLDPGLTQLQAAIEADSRIEFLGVMERDSFFESIDCLVVPSRVPEAFGLVAQEAWFRGVPVLVSNQGALPEAVAGAPSACVYDALDPDGLSVALTTLLADRSRWVHQPRIPAADYQAMERDWAKGYEDALLRASGSKNG
ncbi:MAG: glycosyltransferase [Burkholderiaceae bacterium]|nr:glycosyltransferase [Burkholderiaceae bacterium]